MSNSQGTKKILEGHLLFQQCLLLALAKTHSTKEPNLEDFHIMFHLFPLTKGIYTGDRRHLFTQDDNGYS